MTKDVDVTLAEYYERRYKEIIDTPIKMLFSFLTFKQFLNELYLQGYLESVTINKILELVYNQSVDEIHSDIEAYKKIRGEDNEYINNSIREVESVDKESSSRKL